MKTQHVLIYDGSFKGFLTLIFTVFEEKIEVSAISPEESVQSDMFSSPTFITTDLEKYNRVKLGLKKVLSASADKQLYFAFLSEIKGIEMQLLHYIKEAFRNKNFSSTDFGNPVVLKINQVSKMVSREKHRMEAFVRFQLTKEDIFFATIEPDFNVLPLILKHFESRYADQKWIIYDLKRNFGLFYNLQKTSYINLEFNRDHKEKSDKSSIYKHCEKEFQQLWQEYFSSTNIKSRKNMKLHLQHVPKRYWKYLTEKSSWQN